MLVRAAESATLKSESARPRARFLSFGQEFSLRATRKEIATVYRHFCVTTIVAMIFETPEREGIDFSFLSRDAQHLRFVFARSRGASQVSRKRDLNVT